MMQARNPVEALTRRYAVSGLELDALEDELALALQDEDRFPEGSDGWYLRHAEHLASPPPTATPGTRLRRVHTVLSVDYRARIHGSWPDRREFWLPRTAMLSVGVLRPAYVTDGADAVFIASYRNAGNGYHAFVHTGCDLDAALQAVNAQLGAGRGRRGRPRPFLSRERFDARFRRLAGLRR